MPTWVAHVSLQSLFYTVVIDSFTGCTDWRHAALSVVACALRPRTEHCHIDPIDLCRFADDGFRCVKARMGFWVQSLRTAAPGLSFECAHSTYHRDPVENMRSNYSFVMRTIASRCNT